MEALFLKLVNMGGTVKLLNCIRRNGKIKGFVSRNRKALAVAVCERESTHVGSVSVFLRSYIHVRKVFALFEMNGDFLTCFSVAIGFMRTSAVPLRIFESLINAEIQAESKHGKNKSLAACRYINFAVSKNVENCFYFGSKRRRPFNRDGSEVFL